jgi:ubiquinone/menaquinone biosynthesis C-methylase UbiE
VLRIWREEGLIGLARGVREGVVSHLRPNSIDQNRRAWTRYDWSQRGEEWSDDPVWKQSFVQHVLEPHVVPSSNVLEIGPGAGRWTEHLLSRGAEVTIVDVTEKCINMCRERFKHAKHLRSHVNDGRDLSFVPDASIDRIFSFDVFVHIAAKDIGAYVAQFPRVLAPGGRALIHHARRGRFAPGWRSDMTAERMREFAADSGLRVVNQFLTWDAGRQSIYPTLPVDEQPDVISVLEKA